MELYEIFEMIMVICFGVSWPMNIIKSIKTRSTKGKSFLFLFLIWIGYVAGIVSKIVADKFSYVFIFYIINFVMVSVDMILFYFNRKRERKLENENK